MSKRPPLPPAFDLAACSPEEPENGGISAARCEPMSEIQGHLYIGSWRDVEDPDNLRLHGITHVLNVAKEVDPTLKAEAFDGFKSLHIPLVDEHRENILDYMEAACTFIEDARTVGGKCLVHCRRGISRSPAIVVGYLMRHDDQPYDKAVQFVKDHRACVSLNIAFREFLSSYDTPHMHRKDSEAHSGFDEAVDGHHVEPTPGPSDGSEGGGDVATAGHTASQ